MSRVHRQQESLGAALVVDDLAVAYDTHLALQGVTFQVEWGELVAVIGPNGAGKSTLFKAICGLVDSSGHVAIAGHGCHHRRDRMGAAYIPQHSDADLDYPITVGELVLSGRRRFVPWWRRPGSTDRTAAAEALDLVGLVGLERRALRTLSGGQVQRAFLGRALAQEARILLLDEALSGVDSPRTEHLMSLFQELCDSGVTVLLATHDLALARRRFIRCLAVNQRITADGNPSDVLGSDILDRTFGSAASASAEPITG